MTTNCSNPLCNAELTASNRVVHRTICLTCHRAKKSEARKLARLGDASTDPAVIARKKTAFLDELLRNGGFVERAIKTVSTSRHFVNNAYNSDPDFQKLWDTIRELNNEALENEVYRRAVTGVDEPLSYQGRLTGDVIRKYSDNLLMFYCKANMPGKYRDLPQKGDQMSEEELNTALDKHLAKRTKVISAGEGTAELIM